MTILFGRGISLYMKRYLLFAPFMGVFEQTIANHVHKGSGCGECNKEVIKQGANKKPKQYFIDKALSVHQGYYDYSLWEDVQNTSIDTVTIICPIHGKFQQTPASHIDKQAGCPQCKHRHRPVHHSQQHIINSITLLKDYNWVYDQYIIQEKTATQIATELNISSDATVGRYIKKLGFNTRTNCKFSSLSIQWINSIMVKDNINIQHATNGGEYLIPGTKYKVDGYCQSTNTVYEFHGDYWHGNPQVYPSNYVNKVNYKTMSELYERTIQKEQTIRELGYNLVVVWESEYKKSIQEDII